jgi:hypothetical protein
MKIASSELALQADHAAQTRQQSSETLRAWRGERPDFERADRPALPSAIASISAPARHAFAVAPDLRGAPAVAVPDLRGVASTAVPHAGRFIPPAPTFTAPKTDTAQAEAIDAAFEAADKDPFLVLIRHMIELLTGEKMRVIDMKAFSAETQRSELNAEAITASRATNSGNQRAGFGIEYDYHAVREELEISRFSAQGVVRTADGQEFSFQLNLEMTRYYREETRVSLRLGDAVRKDPLVVNFGGTAAQLSGLANQRFSFDLDGDGHAENLPLFTSGSGYLALDINRNGRIDSGKELFGPQTGKGFAELARLDADGNGWIDANDPDFKHLGVWVPAGSGTGSLKSLAELGIGALALAHATTPFALRSSDNRDLGQVKASGLYLTESGQAGSLQEIDLTV